MRPGTSAAYVFPASHALFVIRKVYIELEMNKVTDWKGGLEELISKGNMLWVVFQWGVYVYETFLEIKCRLMNYHQNMGQRL